MSLATMTTKGQATIPKDIRDGLAAKKSNQFHHDGGRHGDHAGQKPEHHRAA